MAPLGNKGNQLINTGLNLRNRIDFRRCFDWFNCSFTEKLSVASEEFLSSEVSFFLLALTNKPSIIWKGSDYFVTQVEIIRDCSIFIRLSNNAAEILLNKALGKKEDQRGELQLKNITELEAKVLTAYNRFLFEQIKNTFVSKEKLLERQTSPDSMDKLAHLTYYISPDLGNSDEEAGKIIFSFPEYILDEPDYVSLPEEPLNILQFKKSLIELDVYVGRTRVSLEDLQNVENDDIVILEQSNLHTMVLKGDEEIQFNVNPDPGIVIDVNNSEGGEQVVNEINAPSKNIWDSLQVEVSAEFEKIKMSLGDLRQITEGLVVDVASVVQNEIFLQVEGKKIAAGELVIIGDKYGVKISKVFNETKQEQEASVKQAAVQDEESSDEDDAYSEAEEIDDSDFDYSDFEIEDDL